MENEKEDMRFCENCKHCVIMHEGTVCVCLIHQCPIYATCPSYEEAEPPDAADTKARRMLYFLGENMQKINLNFCSFCRKVPEDCQIMIAGPDGVNLCDKCVDLCTKIIGEARAKHNQSLEPTGKDRRFSLDVR